MGHRACGRTRRGLTTGLVALALPAGTAVAAPSTAPAGPDNVIVFIGDGMDYNHVASTNLFETGQTDSSGGRRRPLARSPRP